MLSFQVPQYSTNGMLTSMLRGKEVQSQPGGNTYVDSAGTQQAIRPLFEVDLNLRDLLGDIQDVRSRINDAFYVPLFLMLANDERAQITAREIAERAQRGAPATEESIGEHGRKRRDRDLLAQQRHRAARRRERRGEHRAARTA